jgi:hypothetical protein
MVRIAAGLATLRGTIMLSFSTRAAVAVAIVVAAAGVLAAGSALRPAAAGSMTTIHPDVLVTCSSGGACEVYDNRSSGQAFEGETNHGTGLYGYAATSGVGVEGYSASGEGVFGESGDDIAVEGQGGEWGLYGTGTYEGTYSDGTDYGVVAVSSSAEALYGDGPEGLVAVSSSTSAPAIESYSEGGNIFQGYDSANVSVFHVDGSGNVATSGDMVASSTVYGGNNTASLYGVFGDGEDSGVEGSNLASYDCHCGNGSAFFANGFGGDLYIGNNSAGTDSFIADNSGNITITGKIFTAGSCSSGCVNRPDEPGVHVVSYTPSESQPTMEDFGEGQVTNGSGYVHLESTFSKTIDLTANYMVFITPEGPSRGVYVTQKSSTGFGVMENPGGHSTFAFSWRIVAKPYGDTHARLPMVNMATDMRAKNAMLAPKFAAVHGTQRHPLPAPIH